MQMTRQEIIQELKSILISADEKNRPLVEGCTEQTNLMDTFGFSSVGILYLVIAIEETFQIRFENTTVTDFETLGSVVDYIEAKLK